jgi:hypothetical protein
MTIKVYKASLSTEDKFLISTLISKQQLCFILADVRRPVLFPDQKMIRQSRSATIYTVLLMELPLAAGVQFRNHAWWYSMKTAQ